MNNPKDKSPVGDPKTATDEKDVITNTEEGDKPVNHDGAVADTDGITKTLTESEHSTSDTAKASDVQVSNGDRPTDAEISGDDNIL